MDRKEIMDRIYTQYDEDTRLTRSRQGQLEFLTTMHYIHQRIPSGAKILEVGAGTGRYSIALAKEGYHVTAAELVLHNLEILRRNAAGLSHLHSCQADATDLGAFPDNAFDAVLLLGPMYHLYEKGEQNRAIEEAIRVTKPGGVIMTAFLSVYAILYNNYLTKNFRNGVEENYDTAYRVRHFKEQGFTGFDIKEFERLFAGKPVSKITLAGTDGILELAEQADNFAMTDEDFELLVQYHLHTCEKRELLGFQSHLLYICQKHGTKEADKSESARERGQIFRDRHSR